MADRPATRQGAAAVAEEARRIGNRVGRQRRDRAGPRATSRAAQ